MGHIKNNKKSDTGHSSLPRYERLICHSTKGVSLSAAFSFRVKEKKAEFTAINSHQKCVDGYLQISHNQAKRCLYIDCRAIMYVITCRHTRTVSCFHGHLPLLFCSVIFQPDTLFSRCLTPHPHHPHHSSSWQPSLCFYPSIQLLLLVVPCAKRD